MDDGSLGDGRLVFDDSARTAFETAVNQHGVDRNVRQPVDLAAHGQPRVAQRAPVHTQRAQRHLAIRHVAFEGLDGFTPALKAAGYDIAYAEAVDDLPPAAETADG